MNKLKQFQNYWRNRKRRKSYQLAKFLIGLYLIILSVILLKNISVNLATSHKVEVSLNFI